MTPQEQHFSPHEIAEKWAVSVDFVRTLFRKEPGVLVFSARHAKIKREYQTMRIPESVMLRVYRRCLVSRSVEPIPQAGLDELSPKARNAARLSVRYGVPAAWKPQKEEPRSVEDDN